MSLQICSSATAISDYTLAISVTSQSYDTVSLIGARACTYFKFKYLMANEIWN